MARKSQIRGSLRRAAQREVLSSSFTEQLGRIHGVLLFQVRSQIQRRVHALQNIGMSLRNIIFRVSVEFI